MEERADTKPTRIDATAFKEVCDRQMAKAGPVSYRCDECLDHGLLYYPWRSDTTLTWWHFRCPCGAPGDWGVIPESIKRDRKDNIISSEDGPRKWNPMIPLWTDFRFKDGSPMTRGLLLNLNQRNEVETEIQSGT